MPIMKNVAASTSESYSSHIQASHALHMQATVGSPSQAMGTFLALFLFGAAVIPFCYCVSMAFATPSAGQVKKNRCIHNESIL